MEKILGKCSCCGGKVCVPMYFYSVVAPKPTCKDCGAVAEEEYLPTIKTKELYWSDPHVTIWKSNIKTFKTNLDLDSTNRNLDLNSNF